MGYVCILLATPWLLKVLIVPPSYIAIIMHAFVITGYICEHLHEKSMVIMSFSEWHKFWARPGFEPGTSRTLSENHAPRPTNHSCLCLSTRSVSNDE